MYGLDRPAHPLFGQFMQQGPLTPMHHRYWSAKTGNATASSVYLLPLIFPFPPEPTTTSGQVELPQTTEGCLEDMEAIRPTTTNFHALFDGIRQVNNPAPLSDQQSQSIVRVASKQSEGDVLCDLPQTTPKLATPAAKDGGLVSARSTILNSARSGTSKVSRNTAQSKEKDSKKKSPEKVERVPGTFFPVLHTHTKQ
jgi:hypothetical protein